MNPVKTYSLARDGDRLLGTNFRVREFACKDGADEILVADDLVAILQRIRNQVGLPIRIMSGYRTREHNDRVGGAKNSFHLRGMAADIQITGMKPRALYTLIESGGVLGLNPLRIGMGLYRTFVHVDCRGIKARWAGSGVRLP